MLEDASLGQTALTNPYNSNNAAFWCLYLRNAPDDATGRDFKQNITYLFYKRTLTQIQAIFPPYLIDIYTFYFVIQGALFPSPNSNCATNMYYDSPGRKGLVKC